MTVIKVGSASHAAKSVAVTTMTVTAAGAMIAILALPGRRLAPGTMVPPETMGRVQLRVRRHLRRLGTTVAAVRRSLRRRLLAGEAPDRVKSTQAYLT